jgi:hypothetical protein
LRYRRADALRVVIAIFEEKVRSERGAKRAVTKARQANIDNADIVGLYRIVNL